MGFFMSVGGNDYVITRRCNKLTEFSKGEFNMILKLPNVIEKFVKISVT